MRSIFRFQATWFWVGLDFLAAFIKLMETGLASIWLMGAPIIALKISSSAHLSPGDTQYFALYPNLSFLPLGVQRRSGKLNRVNQNDNWRKFRW